jgi:hypothetical protein
LGDGGLATSAGLNGPTGVAVDSAGDLYIADKINNRIRKVNTSGIISTMAGTGWAGYSGDGGPATSATLYFPTGITLDSSGDLFIADTNNNRVRKVNSSGTITTFAGTGSAGYDCIFTLGLATNVGLHSPTGVAAFGLDVAIADTGNQCVRDVAISNSANGFDISQLITRLASFGTPTSTFTSRMMSITKSLFSSTSPAPSRHSRAMARLALAVTVDLLPPRASTTPLV